MIKRIFILLLGITQLVALADETADLMRFDNGDQLHGEFEGFGDKNSVLWKRNKSDDKTMTFATNDIRQVVLNSGKPEQSLANLSYVGTTNGDRIPGSVQEMDEKRVMIQTDFAGSLEFPRDQVAIIAPNPMGGRVLYHGPFDKKEWIQKNLKHVDGIPMDKDEAEIEKQFPLWKFSGSAWYWKDGRPGTALTRDSGMTDRSVLQFDLAWKNRLSLAVAFHADFNPPDNAVLPSENVSHTGTMSGLPNIFGSCYILHLYSNYVMLYRSGFDEEGKPFMNRLESKNATLRLSNTGTAKVEIRCNRLSGDIMLFIDGQFICDWKEKAGNDINPDAGLDGYHGKGQGFGFVVQMEDSPTRISDVVVADWNGIPDSARSLESDDSDIVLLNNGTDRFSGKISGMKDGKVNLTGKYGNFSFPMTEIAEIRFAKAQLKTTDEEAASDIRVRFHPHGSISGQVVSGTPENVRLLNSSAGEFNINLKSAGILEFKSMNSYLDDWNVEF